AEPATFGRARTDAVGAPEPIEDVRQVVGGDADARVAHRKRDSVQPFAETQIHASAARRVLDRVGHQIEKQLPESLRVAGNGHLFHDRQVHADAGILTEDHRGLIDVANQWLERYRLTDEIESPFVRSRQGQQTVDQIRHSAYFTQRFLERLQ